MDDFIGSEKFMIDEILRCSTAEYDRPHVLYCSDGVFSECKDNERDLLIGN